MAAFLRASSRVCRQIILHTTRNRHKYLRQAQASHLIFEESSVFPSFTFVRRLCDTIPEEKHAEPEVEASTEFDEETPPLDERKPRKLMGKIQYHRMLQKIGALSSKGSLFETFDNILEKEGAFTQLQAYQILRNCGSELVYESPENRTDMAHAFWDKLLAAGVEVDIMMYNALLSIYLQNEHNFDPLEFLEQIQSAGLEPNMITMNLLIKAFGEKGDLDGVFKILELMKAADMAISEPVYGALIMAYWRSGDIDSAKGVFDIMRENGLEPGHESYVTLLRAFAEGGNLEAIDETITEMQEKKIYPNSTVYLTLIDIFGKTGKLDMIPKILAKPTVKRLVELDLQSMMLAFGNSGYIDAALALMSFLPMDGISSYYQLPQRLLLIQVITTRQPINEIIKLIETINNEGVMRNVYETALDVSYSMKNPELSLVIIKEMISKNIVVKEHYFYPILACYADAMNIKETQNILTFMAESGLDVDPFSMNYVIKSFGQSKDADVDSFFNVSKDVKLSPMLLKAIAQVVMDSKSVEKFKHILEYADSNDIQDKTIFSKAFGVVMTKNFDPDIALKFLIELNKTDFTSLLPLKISEVLERKCRVEAMTDKGAQFIQMMLQEGLQDLLQARSYSSIMKSLTFNKQYDKFRELLKVMREYKVPLQKEHYKQMMRMFSFQGDSNSAQFCFNSFKKFQEPDDYMYALLISAYGFVSSGLKQGYQVDRSNAQKILELYEEMKVLGLQPRGRALSRIIMAYIAMDNLEEAMALKQSTSPSLPLSFHVEIPFLKAFANKGDIENTTKVLDGIKNSETMFLSPHIYTIAIGAYKFSGDIDSQRNLIKEMQERNLAPTDLTFDELLGTYLLKDDINGALQILEEAKANNCHFTSNGCLQLANACGKAAPEKLDQVVNEIIDCKVKAIPEGYQDYLLYGLVSVCVSNGRKDLAEDIIAKTLPDENQYCYAKAAFFFTRSGDPEAILKVQQFLEERKMRASLLLVSLIKAYETKGDPEGALQAYNTFVDSGGQPWYELQVFLSRVLQRHDQEVPFKISERRQRPEKADDDIVSVNEDIDTSDIEDEGESST